MVGLEWSAAQERRRSCYMLICVQDDWLHADLHPGNIIVRTHEGPQLPAMLEAALNSLLQPLLGLQVRDCLRSVTLSIVDAGMVTAMDPGHFRALLEVHTGLMKLDGAQVASGMINLQHKAGSVRCDYTEFQRDVDKIFADVDRETMRTHTNEIVREVLEKMRKNRMTLDPGASTTMLTVLALEGWATALYPDIRILDAVGGLLPTAPNIRLQNTVDMLVSADLLDSL
jgi:aarF domain-containing kinase